ncbi:23S rRNA pseudouridine(2604) synthase RluF [Desertivirga xinjiangensis]|uniref:23S rRNA pseudouridine(2604) synthase RluF n=1 Tax=Desertivirga xinjiangensis TaxID=539206 RepID=UPI00210AFCCE|nr:23S rRNA pseudouridine(2604) synthase RluF [Pedobacter xinjiangensis]
MSENNSIRLNKYISESGICSRREADRYIERGNVFINGKRAKIGDQVFPGDRVMVNGNNIEPRDEEDFILIAFNKPVGITTTTEAGVRDNIVDYVNHSDRIFPIGRLDKDSQGLIFLTNNGDIVNKILRAGNKHEKEYLVTVDKPITEQFIESMSSGVPILGVMTRKCRVSKESTFVFKIILMQGLNRQIRRMCEHFDYEVVKLERTRIMNVSLKGLPIGEWRELTEEERSEILRAVKDSSSDHHKVKKTKNEVFKGDNKNEPKHRNNPDKRFSGGLHGTASKDQHRSKRGGERHSSGASASGPSRKTGKSASGGKSGGRPKGRQR